jgi:transposase-like protein
VETLRQLAHSRTALARAVERTRSVWLAHQGRRVPAIAQELHLTPTTVRSWLKRFKRQGLAGLREKPRPGRPPLYTSEQVSEVIATSLTNPGTPLFRGICHSDELFVDIQTDITCLE